MFDLYDPFYLIYRDPFSNQDSFSLTLQFKNGATPNRVKIEKDYEYIDIYYTTKNGKPGRHTHCIAGVKGQFDKAEAEFLNGYLTIRIPSPPPPQGEKITVET